MASRPAPPPSHCSNEIYPGDLSRLFEEIDAIETGPTSSTTTSTLVADNAHNTASSSPFSILPPETPIYNDYHPQLNLFTAPPTAPPLPSPLHQQQPSAAFPYDTFNSTAEDIMADPHVGSMQPQFSALDMDLSPQLYMYNPENTASVASTQQHHSPAPPPPDPQLSLPASPPTTTSSYNDAAAYNTQGRSITFATAATSNGYLLQQPDALSAWRSQQTSMTSLSRKTSRSSIGGGGGGGALSRSNSRSSNGRYQYRSRTSSSSGSAITLYSNSNEPHQCIVPGCNKTFSRKRDIWRHFFFVHKGMPFMHMGASLVSGLQFTCEKCGKDYSRKDSLKRHQQKKHPELFDPSPASSPSKPKTKQ